MFEWGFLTLRCVEYDRCCLFFAHLVDVVEGALDEVQLLGGAERGADVLQRFDALAVTNFLQVRQALRLLSQHALVQQPEPSAKGVSYVCVS